jgi:hypothetical protein
MVIKKREECFLVGNLEGKEISWMWERKRDR